MTDSHGDADADAAADADADADAAASEARKPGGRRPHGGSHHRPPESEPERPAGAEDQTKPPASAATPNEEASGA